VTDALMGIACGILAAAAAFGIIGQTGKHRPAPQRGAQAAGMLGTIIILVALLVHGLAASSPQYFFDSAGRALSIASLGLVITWLPLLRRRSTSRMGAEGSDHDEQPARTTGSLEEAAIHPWWALGLAAALAGWAEFVPANEAIASASTLLTGIPLLVAGGIAVPIADRAAARLLKREVHPTARQGFPMLAAATALVLLAMLIFCAQTFLAVGSLWPQAAGFKAMAGAGLILLSACLTKDRRAGLWLSILSALVLVIVLLLPGVWVAS
jgi:hypothetical protein